MGQKSWRLIVAELGSGATIHDVSVEASDWMTALTLARTRIGERGGIPPGATCSVSSDGVVTLLDAVTRKRYRLDPRGAASTQPPPAPAPASSPPASSPPGPPAVSVSKRTVAFEASNMGLPSFGSASGLVVGSPVSSSSPPPARGPTSAGPTVRASAVPAAAPRESLTSTLPSSHEGASPPPGFSGGVDGSAASTRTSASEQPSIVPVVPRPVSVPAPAPRSDRAERPRSVPKHTVAYVVAPDEGPTVAAAKDDAVTAKTALPPEDTEKALPPSLPLQTEPPRALEADDTPSGPSTTTAVPSPPTSAPTTSRPPPPAVVVGEIAELVFARDGEPGADSPLLYRERHYVVPEGTSSAVAKEVLLHLFAQVRESLAERPRGKLVKMAVFDHRWEGHPRRPPLMALQWKDWRGEPEILDGAASVARAAAQQRELEQQRRRNDIADAEAARRAAEEEIAARAREAEAARRAAEAVRVADVQRPLAADRPDASDPAASTSTANEGRPIDGHSSPREDFGSTLRDVPAVAAPAGPPVVPSSSVGSTLASERLADAFEGLRDLFFLQSPLEAAEFVERLLADLIPCEAASVALYDINANEMRFVATSGPGATERKGEAVPTHLGLLGEALLSYGQCLRVDDVSTDARFDAGVDGRVGLEALNMLIKPVHAGDRLLGVIQLINRVGDVAFSAGDESVLAYVTDKFGDFLAQSKAAADRPRRRPGGPGL